MRILLFRAKRMDTGDWIYGHYMEFGAAAKRVYCIAPDYASSMCVVDVCKKTVGQFTGLIDRNGKRIFEGDIVRCPSGRSYTVGWNPFSAAWEIVGNGKHFLFAMRVMDLFEVIGNIHDTHSPEQHYETST